MDNRYVILRFLFGDDPCDRGWPLVWNVNDLNIVSPRRDTSASAVQRSGKQILSASHQVSSPGCTPDEVCSRWRRVHSGVRNTEFSSHNAVIVRRHRELWASCQIERERERWREGERDRYNQTGEEYHRWNHAARSFWWNLAHAVKCEPSKCHVQLIRRYLHSPFMFGPKKTHKKNSSFLTHSQLKHLLIYLLYLVGNRTRPSQRYMWITILYYHDLPNRLAVVVVIAPSERCLPDYRPQFCITRQCQSEIMFVFLQNNYVLLHAPTTLIQFKASLAKKKKPWTKLRVGVDTCN